MLSSSLTLKSKKISLKAIIILTLIPLFAGFVFLGKPRVHFLNMGGYCSVSGYVGLGEPVRERKCLCLGAFSRQHTGWIEGPLTYTCGGIGISFEEFTAP